MVNRSEVIFSYENEEENKQCIKSLQENTARDIEYKKLYFIIDIITALAIYYFTQSIFFCVAIFAYTEIIRHLRILSAQNTRILSTLLIILEKTNHKDN